MKCTQVGFTVFEMLATIYLGLKFGPTTVGFFLPDQETASRISTNRFMPIVRTMPAVHKLMMQDASWTAAVECPARATRAPEA